MNANDSQESIAIVGMAGRFPHAKNLEEFWRNLREGRECISFFKDEPIQWLPIEHPPKPDDPRYVRARGVLEKPEWFDAAFFGMNPKEAEIMDPQHRVFMECAWEALENAGCNPDTYEGLIGVFAGASMNTYLLTNLLTNRDLVADYGMFSSLIMNDGDFVPTRVSYKFNLRGPSINVQTACSTSLVAVALAAQNLLGYRCDVALAGGVSITFPPNRGQFHLEGGILSKDGHCRTFDAEASGTVLGDGAGVVVLKRLSDAIADGDRICAVIKGTAINNDGSVKIGYTAPSIDGQAEVIAMAHSEAGFAPETVSYVEAHGTGTPLGDPIEIAGLTKAFGLDGKRGQFCALGSVKSNIGHLDIGAGVAGLIKTVLALQHGEIPPSLHFENPNPKIDLANSPFFVNNALRPWQPKAGPRRAGVSSFGIGGTNAHVAVEEAPKLEPTSKSRPKHLLVLSAKTATALDTMTENLAAHLEQAGGKADLADVAFTLQTGRKVFAKRRAVVAENVTDAVQMLRCKDTKRMVSGGTEEAPGTVAFMFPGQGAQAVNMARELYESESEFRSNVDRCCELLRPKLGLDLREVIFPQTNAAEAAKLLTETRITQPAMFVIEHALAQLWMSWGIKPAAMIGHSLGEYVAATIAGVFTLEDALALVAERARLMQAQPAGAMLAVRQPEQQVTASLSKNLALAAVNAPGLCVVSGPFDAVEAEEKRLTASAIPFKRLATSHAFHSAMMEPALAPLAAFVRKLKLSAPKIPWISNVTGKWITPEQAMSPDYWTTHLRQTVRFADGVAELVKAGHRVLLEVGPGQTLAGLARQSTTGSGATVVATLGRATEGTDLSAMLLALGELWVAGVVPAWREGFYRNETRRVAALPTYPFERKRYWIEPGMKFALGETAPVGERVISHALERTATSEASAGATRSTSEAATTLTTLRALFQDLSGIDLAAAAADRSFYELGFDSLFLTQASLAVNRKFGVQITFRQLREDLQSLQKLAEHIDSLATQAAAPVTPVRDTLKIDPAAEKRVPLTDAQREMWFASQLGTAASAAYNESSTLRLKGNLDVEALHRALRKLVERHEALRTTFSADGESQLIAPVASIDLPLHDYSNEVASSREARANECIDQEVQRTFDLVNGPLFRTTLVRIEPASHLLALVVHHIICDGWSLGVIMRELAELYSAEKEQRATSLAPAPAFSDYAQKQSAARNTPAFAADEAFWKQQFADSVPVLDLPTDRPRPTERSFAGGFELTTLPAEVATAVKKICRERDCTPFTVLLSAFNVLLHRLTGQDDVVVGVPSAAQVMDGLENLVGHFANLLPMRSRIGGERTFADYLNETRQNMTTALEHWRYPFGALIKELNLPRDATRVPLAPVVFNTTRRRGQLAFEGVAAEIAGNPKRSVNFDLNFNFMLADDAITLGCYYSTELFDRSTIARWFGHFETLLRAIAANPETPLQQLPLLTETERRQILVEWNNTAMPYRREACIHELFEEQVRRSPEAVAIVGETERVTYAELNRRADVIAARLRAAGVGADARVGLFLRRTPQLLAGILGILKAGAGYVPLDPAYPTDRLKFIVEDTQMAVLVTERALVGEQPAGSMQSIVIDDPAPVAGATTGTAAAQPTAESLAYIIYTSGSTGKPKGVQITQRCVTALVAWAQQLYTPDELGGVFFSTSVSFDISIFEIFCPLCLGGRLIIAENILQLATHPARDEVTFLSGVPSAMAEVVRTRIIPSSVTTVALAGELFPQPLVDALYALPHMRRVFEHYGPTETTVYSTGSLRKAGGKPSLGYPFPNERVYVLDRNLQPVPIGVGGELYIGGDKLARGYLHRPELTAEKFLIAPFLAGERIYKTGDGARFLADGSLEFLGRLDHQVKIRGFRVELGEVEAALARHPSVAECAVITRPDASGNNRLLAYVMSRSGAAAEVRDLREHLAKELPHYMVPSAITVLEKFPLTANGKLDRRALPEPDFTAAATSQVAPRTPTEEMLATIWRDVLGLETVGVHDNFFELGGHSLLAAQVIGRVLAVARTELTLRQFFGTPTIAGLAATIQAAAKGEFAQTSIPRRSTEGNIPVSFAQERMWLVDQLEPGQATYNLCQAVRLEGALDLGVLERTLNLIIRRHESLRTNFMATNGRATQVIAPSRTLAVAVVDLSDRNGSTPSELTRHLNEESRRPFDLERDLLVRALLVRTGPQDHTLMLTMHHIVSDGWSVGVLFRELATTYRALLAGAAVPLAELPIQYADFACWERENLQGEALDRLLTFWKSQLGGTLPVLELPYDRPRSAAEGARAATQSIDLPRSLTQALKELGQQEGATLFMTLLAAFQTLLHRWTGQEDIVVGSVAAGRRKRELEQLIGFFVNTLVFRGDLSGDPTAREMLARVRDTTLGVLAHQDLPFDRLVSELRPDRTLSRNPLFQVLFVLQNAPISSLDLPGLRADPVDVEPATAKFDLTLAAMEMPNGLRVAFEYNADLFEADTIKRLLRCFETLLDNMVAHPAQRISELEILSAAERKQLLVEWNDTRIDYPSDACVHHLFEEQVRRTPDAIAVAGEGERLTYRELDRRAAQLAAKLRAEGIGPDSLVGIFLNRKPQLLVGLLGVLKAGGAYVPLDPAYPADRLSYIVQHARMTTLVTERELVGQVPTGNARTLLVEDSTASSGAVTLPTLQQSPQSLAYVIYTSGSTGQPKGVAIEHRSVVALIAWARQAYRPDELAGVVASTSACFDVSVFEMFVPLCAGGTVIVAENVLELPRIQTADRMTLMSGVPSAIAELVRRDKIPPTVCTVNLAGEPCPQTLVEALYQKPHITRVVDLYGPTETTVYSTFAQRKAGGRATIGRPLANEQVYILDRAMRPVPVGVPGELYIGGAGLARGYLHQPELTTQRFVADPFHPGERLYRTGDRVRYRSDGNIEFLGRLDHQIKLRGFRIELGEIEAVLTQHSAVRECVALVRTDQPNDPRLVAYVVPADQASFDPRGLKVHLQQRLPDYMVPSAIVALEKIPLAPNGKIDRRALPAPDANTTTDAAAYVAPRNATEELLADIWRDVLGLKQVGVHDNFFDLGGHSLLATQVMARISDFLGVELTVRQLFSAPTVATMAPLIEAALIEDIKSSTNTDFPTAAVSPFAGDGAEKLAPTARTGAALATTKE